MSHKLTFSLDVEIEGNKELAESNLKLLLERKLVSQKEYNPTQDKEFNYYFKINGVE